MAKNLQTFAQKVYTRISVRYTASNHQSLVIHGANQIYQEPHQHGV